MNWSKIYTPLIRHERYQVILWVPVIILCGIAFYFSLPSEPPDELFVALAIFFALFLGYGLLDPSFIIRAISLTCALFALGLIMPKYWTYSNNTATIERKTSAITLTGVIEKHTTSHRNTSLLLSDIVSDDLNTRTLPQRIKLSTTQKNLNLSAGDYIQTRAILMPPPKPVYPGSYNMALMAKFQHIGATGYIIGPILTLNHATRYSIKDWIQSRRHAIDQSIIHHLPKRTASVAMALMTGNRKHILDEDYELLRNAGIAHLLAISGMHIALIAFISFKASRWLFARNEYCLLYYPIKTWAAFCAVAMSFIYLLLVDAPTSAQRAFIMVTLICMATIIDRHNTPMRSLALAATIILIITPESLLTASFQMSFIAALALISIFELCYKRSEPTDYQRPIFFRIISTCTRYINVTLLSSLVAGLATAPFAYYHFGHVAPYGMIANLIAIPITSLWIMPAMLLGLIALPIGLEALPLYIMQSGIAQLLFLSETIETLPAITIPNIHYDSFILFVVSITMIWGLIWKTWIRYTLIPIALIIIIFTTEHSKRPNLLIDQTGQLIAYFEPSSLTMLHSNNQRFTQAIWQQHYAGTPIIKEQLYAPLNKATPYGKHLTCDALSCIITYNQHIIALTKHPFALKSDCAHANLIINLTYIKAPCRYYKRVINHWDLWKHGIHMLSLNDQTITVNTINQHIGSRPWNP